MVAKKYISLENHRHVPLIVYIIVLRLHGLILIQLRLDI